jgi:hypothetical protein
MENTPQEIMDKYKKGRADVLYSCDLTLKLDSENNTPLHLMAKADDVDGLLKIFREGKITPKVLNQQTTKGDTPLHIAVQQSQKTGRAQMAQLLVDMGARTDIINSSGDQIYLEDVIHHHDTFTDDNKFLEKLIKAYAPKVEEYMESQQRGGAKKKASKSVTRKQQLSEVEPVFSTESENQYNELYKYRQNTISDLEKMVELNRRRTSQISKIHEKVIKRIKEVMPDISDITANDLKKYLSYKISQDMKELTAIERAKKLEQMVEKMEDKKLLALLKDVDIEKLRALYEERRAAKIKEREMMTESSDEESMNDSDKKEQKKKSKKAAEDTSGTTKTKKTSEDDSSAKKKTTKKQKGGYTYDRVSTLLESEDF